LTISGGTLPYSIVWSNSETTEDISNLPAGYYRVSVEDADSLTPPSMAEITLVEPRLITLITDPYKYPNTFNISVYGACNGSLINTITDGVPPFTYLWSDGATTKDRSTICAGSYKLTVTDINNCKLNSDIILMKEPERGDWQLTGNQGLNPATQFIGTSDNTDLVFKTNNTESARLKANGEFKIDRIISGRIVSPDSLIYFGDSTIIFSTSYNRLYGDPPGTTNKGTAIGLRAFCAGLYSSSMGYNTSSAGQYSVAIGYRVQAQQNYSFIIGSGTSTTNMNNNLNNTIMLGCNSTVPTVFISSANGGTTTGNVGIGTTNIPNGYKLAVDGRIIATELKIQLKNLWPPDYVFEKNYKLMSLGELKNFIENNKHLPEIPTSKNMLDNGVDTSEMLMLLLKKVEELTLYIIQQQSEIEILKEKNDR